MFFLTNVYERRFNENMSKHRMDAKIAPSKPKPSCRFVQNNDIQRQPENLGRFHLANELKTEMPTIGQHIPRTHIDSFCSQDSVADNQLNLVDGQKANPLIIGKPFKRTNSNESGFYTGSNSDVASNFSVSA